MKAVLKNSLALLMSLCLCTLTACGIDAEPGKSVPASPVEALQKLPKLLDLGAHECIPCKKMAPILDELKKEYTGVFDVEFIDVWQPENKEKAQAFAIKSIPTQIFFDADGSEFWRHVGFLSREDILAKWTEHGLSLKKEVSSKVSLSTSTGENGE